MGLKAIPPRTAFFLLIAKSQLSSLLVCSNETCFVQLRAFCDDHALGRLLAELR
jgi:hypothetical protein